MKFFCQILKIEIIISVLLLFTSASLGQDKAITSDRIELRLVKNKNPNFANSPDASAFSVIQNLKFKFTVSDSWFGRDKVHHFLTSAFLSGVGYYFLRDEQGYSNQFSQQGGFGFSISLGLIKEIRDGFKSQNAFSVKDLVADILGTLVGIAIISDL